MQKHAIPYNPIQYRATEYQTIQFYAMHDTIQNIFTNNIQLLYNTMLFNNIKYYTMLRNTIQYYTILYKYHHNTAMSYKTQNTLQQNKIQKNTIEYCLCFL